MKKVLSILVCGIILLSLTGCGEAKVYKEAAAALEAGSYAQVIQLLDTIPDYKDKDGIRAQAEEMIAYQNAVSLYEEALAQANNENTAIDSLCSPAQELLSTGEIPYDQSKITELQIAVSTLIEMKKGISTMPDSTDDILSAAEVLSAPLDYSVEQANIQNAQKALEDSIEQMKQITNPSGDFVILRLSQVQGVGEIQGVTEEQDPNGMLNKQGGYTSATFFSSLLLGGTRPLVDCTDGGGCIEVFPTAAEAEVRNSYLATFDGTGFSSGSHVVLGTIIIRTSNNLTATQQKELTAAIIEKLLELQ
jgi:hypothetical protein